jgi:glycosyltransferase involved in cell wall biosynthesis
MTFCIISHVPHTEKEHHVYGYAPYINEMNIWLQFVDKVIVVAPFENYKLNAIHASYKHDNIHFIKAEKFDTLSFSHIINSIIAVPTNCWQIFKAMQKADHIHLRCPGNMGLLGCLIQIGFPKKKKSAKYAGNWDPKSKQPLTYRFQKWLLGNTFLTKNMQVLVYGEWENQSKNIKPFFTATYNENEKVTVQPRILEKNIQFIFVGSLTKGKQPLYAIQLIKKLKEKGLNVSLSLFGEGNVKQLLEDFISDNKLSNVTALEGNLSRKELKSKYQTSHFLVLPSKSEGWPKVVAEAMFWGCVPIATKVSCIPTMLDFGNRGILLSENSDEDVLQIEQLCTNQNEYNSKANLAINWSRNYTLDVFENEIKKIILS